MKLTVTQDNLIAALEIAGKVVEKSPNMPVLANLLLEASAEGMLKVTGTDLASTAVVEISAKVDEPGAITLPAKTLTELVKQLSPEQIHMTLDVPTQTMKLHCGAARTQIKGITAEEYPKVRQAESWPTDLPSGTLATMIKKTVICVAKEDNRPILTGLHMKLENGCLEFAGADGYRLAVMKKPVNSTHNGIYAIPAEVLAKFAALIDEPKDVLVGFDEEHIYFSYENITFSILLLEGRFPAYDALIPKSYNTRATVYTDELFKACKRAEIFARDSNYSTRFIIKPSAAPGESGTFQVIGKSAERGDNEGVIDASVEGDELTVAFNVKYVLQILDVVTTERVVLETNGPAHPGVLRPDDGSATYIIMPMATNR